MTADRGAALADRGTVAGRRSSNLAVVGFGYELGTLLDGQRPVTVIAGAPDDDATARIAATLEEALARSEHLVVVAAGWTGPEEQRRLDTALTAVGTDRVAVLPSDLPPLAGGVLAALAAALSEHLTAGVLVAGLEAIAAELVVVGWVRSVSGLTRPDVSVLLHGASLLPGGRGFGVGLQPEEFVRRLRPDREVPLALAAETSALAVADRGGDVSWVTDVVNPQLGGLPVTEVESPSRAPEWWGGRKLTEIVAYPADLPALAARVGDRQTARCGWCETSVAAGSCPFCGHTA